MNWILRLLFIAFLFWVSIVDVCKRIIPDKAIGIAILVRFVFAIFTEEMKWQGIVGLFLNGLVVTVPLLLLVLIMERVLRIELMGGGDIKLLFVIGMYIGWEKSLIAFLVACVIGIIAGLIERRNGDIYFPFGPSIALGTVISMLIG